MLTVTPAPLPVPKWDVAPIKWRGISLRTTALTFFDPIGAAPALRTVKAFLAEKTDSDGVNSWQMR